MRLTFLGTSHGNHTYSRYNSSTLLQVGDSDYLIDCGEPVAGRSADLGGLYDALLPFPYSISHDGAGASVLRRSQGCVRRTLGGTPPSRTFQRPGRASTPSAVRRTVGRRPTWSVALTGRSTADRPADG